ncbi:MAG: hypothetical protein IPL32_10085 [Chloracidobacterium sp.]|nr:hypothetical protein [Chloracidobacterium sp.]
MSRINSFPGLRFFRTFSITAVIACFAIAAFAQSALDGFDPNANGAVRSIVVQADGKILLGGVFTTLSPNGGTPVVRNHIARLNPDGTLDAAFDPNVNGSIVAIAVQSNGQILIGGLFTTVSPNGSAAVTRNNIARLNSDGTLDANFDPNANGNIFSLAVQTDGKVLAGGLFTTIGGQTRIFFARLDGTTGEADSFDPNSNAPVSAITLQPSGKILVGGSFTNIGGQVRNRIARLDPASGLADSFDPDAGQAVLSIAVQADGKVLAGGQFLTMGGQQRYRIARLEPVNGAVDAFNPIADNIVNSVVVQADGNVLLGGFFTTIGPSDRPAAPSGPIGQPRNYIARIDAITGLPDSFKPTANQAVFSLAVQPDGKILAGGLFTTLAPNMGTPVPRNRIARIETYASQSGNISGIITYGNADVSPRFVSNVFLSGAGSVPVSAFSSFPDGTYGLSGFGSGSYTVTPTKKGDVNGITSFDAARVAQHTAGVNALTGNQLIVADVSGNGTISSFDAGQIARYTSGLQGFGSTGSWRFTPASRNYASVAGNITDEDFTALLMGEVSGNWTNTGAKPIANKR